MNITRVHHMAIMPSHYARSKPFYTAFLGLTVIQEIHRKERDSYKLDLALNGEYIIELFSFPYPPERPSRPESTDLESCLNGNLGLYVG